MIPNLASSNQRGGGRRQRVERVRVGRRRRIGVEDAVAAVGADRLDTPAESACPERADHPRAVVDDPTLERDAAGQTGTPRPACVHARDAAPVGAPRDRRRERADGTDAGARADLDRLAGDAAADGRTGEQVACGGAGGRADARRRRHRDQEEQQDHGHSRQP
jgi:hypothetical protein